MLVLLFTYFGLGLAGDPTPFIVATILYTFCVAAFGTMVGATIPSQVAAMQVVALGGFLLVFLLSGLIFPIENIPVGLRWISNFMWGRYYIEVVRMRYSKVAAGSPTGGRSRSSASSARFSTGLMVQHAPNAAQSVSVVK